jgi:hypothetical protein
MNRLDSLCGQVEKDWSLIMREVGQIFTPEIWAKFAEF